uniref:hypothetical protein n=1 Tax=Dictyotopsis propagulifera TaxID=670095 RepID=UPI002E77F998|nr:hypothetical protein V2485_pgp007 [Dictyotopsis propagulifera]WAM63250.1 hypothetical protein [Dictyotopsis propagulifera]
MSHYTAIKTKYKNFPLLKKCITKLAHPYSEHKNKIEVYTIPSISLSSLLYKKAYVNYLSFEQTENNYTVISDPQSWSQKNLFTEFLNKLEINYGYSEIISQAIELGFTRSKKILNQKQNNKFVFQRCIEIQG